MENSGAGEITLSTNANIDEVKTYLEKQDLDGAYNFLNEFLKTSPDNYQACFVMAQILEMKGDFSEAATYYEKVFPAEIPPEFYARVINVYESADKYDKLYDIYKAAYEKNKQDYELCERFANTCCILKKEDEAISLYNSILLKEPDNIIALRQLIDIYEQKNKMMFYLTKGKLSELEGIFEKAEKEYKKAFSLAENDDDALLVRYKLAHLYKTNNKLEQALDEYIYILSGGEDNFNVCMRLAEIYLELNNSSSAINILKKGLGIYPDNIDALQLLAEIYTENQNYREAQECYEKIISLDGSSIENLVNLAKIYLYLNKLDKTKEILDEAEKKDALNTEVITALAGYYTYIEDFDKAKNYCNLIIQKLPGSPLGYRKLAQLYGAMNEHALCHYNYGIYHELKDDIDEAINEFNYALSCNKNDFAAMQKLAVLYEKNNELQAAGDYYNTLYENGIDKVENFRKIVELYIKTGEYDIAQKYLDNETDYKNDVELLFLAGKCQYKLKDYETALENLETYKEKTKSLANIEETNDLINKIKDKKENSYSIFSKLFKFLD